LNCLYVYSNGCQSMEVSRLKSTVGGSVGQYIKQACYEILQKASETDTGTRDRLGFHTCREICLAERLKLLTKGSAPWSWFS